MTSVSQASEFELRDVFHNVDVISSAQLKARYHDVIIIDVRSDFEYGVIHIDQAYNISVSNLGFIQRLSEIVPNKGDHIAFYCNGINCAKNYKASVKAMKAGYQNVYSYDAGISAWADAYPEYTKLLGKPLIESSNLISELEFESKQLNKTEFEAAVLENHTFLIDVRDAVQRKKTPEFARGARTVSLDRFSSLLKHRSFMTQTTDKTLLIMDATGQQIRWLQYILQTRNVKYRFLKGGVWSYYQEKGALK